ncbi:hypothetical protein [Nonlabens sp. Asnod3-A02]|uniref:hypothetical protein n=1 Tax=Nonlabens sp. Asnod3-A02 TaxID=3160579 RepID=UPI00386B47B0
MNKLKKWLFHADNEKAKVVKSIFYGSLASFISIIITCQTMFYQTKNGEYTEIYRLGYHQMGGTYPKGFAMKINYDEFLIILIFIIFSTLSYSIIKKTK